MPSRSILEELEPWSDGSPLSRVALAARRARTIRDQMRQPNSQAMAQSPTQAQGGGGAPATTKEPSIAAQLLAQGVFFDPRSGAAVQPEGEDWIPLASLPAEVQGWVGKNVRPGVAMAGIQPSAVTDPKQRALLDQWVAIARQRSEARLAADPEVQQRIKYEQERPQPSEAQQRMINEFRARQEAEERKRQLREQQRSQQR